MKGTLRVLEGPTSGESISIRDAAVVGRDAGADLVLADDEVSRRHARLHVDGAGVAIEDLGSVNGTFVNGIRIEGKQRVEPGDRIRIGRAVFELAPASAAGSAGLRVVNGPRAGETVSGVVGRDPAVEVQLDDEEISRRHLRVWAEGDALWVEDLGSANGTFVNGERIAGRVALAPGDSVRIGRTTLEHPAPAVAPAPAPESEPPAADGPLEIPYAVRWLVPKGERFANFDILNDNDTQLDYYRRFGHIYAVGIPTKKWRIVVVSDPELLDEVAANEEQFGKRVEEINFFAQLANSRGGGVSVIGDGAHYDSVRRVMLPWYAPSNQQTQLPRMKEQARELVDAWAALPEGEALDARSWIERYTLEVSGRGACNYDFGLFDGDDPHGFAVAVSESTKESIARVAEPRPDSPLLTGRARRAQRARYRRHNKELFATADALVRGRLNTAPSGTQTDLLSRLLTVPDPETGEKLDHETVRDQILMHLSNGFNGPSITGAWLVYVLATHPDVEEKLIAEIDGISGGDPDYDLQYEDLMRLPYTTQVIKETLRIYPPMPITVRRSHKDGRLGHYRIRKDDVIFVGTLAAQRDPRYWGPNADEFDPEQFAMEKVVGRPLHAFIPFSIGKRQCMAQEVTFMMLRVVLFEIYKRYRLQLAPGATVTKNTIVTTKPGSVPVVRLLRETRRAAPAVVVPEPEPPPPPVAAGRIWDRPSEIPATSEFRHLVIAYGSNFGTNKGLAERFAERAGTFGYTTDLLTLNELADTPAPDRPWLLVVMTPTYTSNPPTNAVAFKSLLERAEPGTAAWRSCRYVVWGLGNSQWNAFLAFPRYVHERLSALGAEPLADFSFADVSSPLWNQTHAEWQDRVWPKLLELSGARPTEAAAVHAAAVKAATRELTRADSTTAMSRSLLVEGIPPGTLLAPTILTNAVGIETVKARAVACRELQAAESPKRTRHVEVSLPAGIGYAAGDHLGVCPRNDVERVERLAERLGAAPDGLLMVPKSMNVQGVPKGVVLQTRNVLTNLVDISCLPTVALLDLLVSKARDPGECAQLEEIRDVLLTPDGPGSPLRELVLDGGYDVLALLDEFSSCSLNVFEFLQVAQPLRPRFYSTSSSPRIHGDGVAHVAVGLEARGVCSSYLHSVREGDQLDVFLDHDAGFHLQDDVAKPMIFVSAGTGFAPMRAFLWERLALGRSGATLAEAVLFNGIRSSKLDYIYRDEIEQFAAEGVLDHVHVVASREHAQREYVQDRIRDEGALVWRLLTAGGYVYVCGSLPMREAVRAAFVDVVAEQGSLPREHAEVYLTDLETTADRYRPDTWG
jgi:cytochrome P450 / NADPH-cytochrome P450 reductase